jgi:hypothetical protein
MGEIGEDLTLSMVRGAGMLAKATAIAAYSTRLGLTKVLQAIVFLYRGCDEGSSEGQTRLSLCHRLCSVQFCLLLSFFFVAMSFLRARIVLVVLSGHGVMLGCSCLPRWARAP